MDDLSLRDLLLVLRRHLRWVLGLPISLAVLAALYAVLLVPDAYVAVATASILPDRVESRLEGKITSAAAPGFSTEEVQRIALSRPVLQEALAVLQERRAAAGWDDADALRRSLTLDFPRPQAVSPGAEPPSSLVAFAARSPDAAAAAEAANAWASRTLEAINRLPTQRLGVSITAMRRELKAADERLAAAESAFRRLEASRSLVLQEASLEADVRERARLDAQRAGLRGDVRVLDAQLEAQGQNLAASAGEEAQRLRASANDLRVARAQARAQLANLEERARELDARIAKARGLVADAQVEASRVEQRLNLARSDYSALSRKLTDLTIEQASAGTLAQPLTPAVAPSSRAPKNSAIIVAAALVVGGLIGLLVPFLIEAARDPETAADPAGSGRPKSADGPAFRATSRDPEGRV